MFSQLGCKIGHVMPIKGAISFFFFFMWEGGQTSNLLNLSPIESHKLFHVVIKKAAKFMLSTVDSNTEVETLIAGSGALTMKFQIS